MNTKKYLQSLAIASVLTLSGLSLTVGSAVATVQRPTSTPVPITGDSAHIAGLKASYANVDLKPLDASSSANQKIQFAMTLKLRHEKELQQLILDQANPNSTHFQKYLTVSEFTREFGPTRDQYLQVISFLTSNGLRIVAVTPNRLVIEGEGTNDQLNRLFGEQTDVYQSANGAKYFKTQKPAKVPHQFAGFVKNVIVEDSTHLSHDHIVRNSSATIGRPTGLDPLQLATAYDYPNANNQANLGHNAKTYSGRGVTIAIATAETYNNSDVYGFWKQLGIVRTGSITNININGVTQRLNIETTLDLEQIGANAPGANILMYEANTSNDLDFVMMFNRIVTDNQADIISHSWGGVESQQNPADTAVENEIFEEAAAQGIAIFVASGDDGAYDTPDGNSQSTVPSVDFPASNPFVTAVGGTTLVVDSNALRDIEVAWNGAGGGASDLYGRPVWQVGSGLPANNRRNSADVSMNADPSTGMPLLFQDQWIMAGGTSFAAPNWASGWGLALEAAHHRIGMPNLYIYKIANSKAYSSVFYDVTYNNNGFGIGPGYNAGSGYDHPTGWGTPDMAKLTTWLVNYHAKSTIQAPTQPVAIPVTTARQSIAAMVGILLVALLMFLLTIFIKW